MKSHEFIRERVANNSTNKVAEDGGTGAGGFATSMGGGNGFLNGGPGTIARETKPKRKAKAKAK